MRIFLLTTLTMIAFAGNSVFNRMALADGAIGPASFAMIRLMVGTVVLLAIVFLPPKTTTLSALRPRPLAVAGLALYATAFSFAYVSLDAGFGALLLFGTVQITMFGGAVVQGNRPHPLQWGGALLGMAGLIYLMNPSVAGVDLSATLLMIASGFGWGIYSLAGQKTQDALLSTTSSFVFAVPVALIVWALVGAEPTSLRGISLAALSGGVTSALGYVLWFYVLRHIQTVTAAVAQLCVPIIAMLGGMVFLSETWTADFSIAASLVLGGIALSIWAGLKR